MRSKNSKTCDKPVSFKRYWTADFEATTKAPTKVWSWGVCNIEDNDKITLGTKLDDFMLWCKTQRNAVVSFHNLKYDGNFILYWLEKNGFKCINDKKERANRTYTTLIGDTGQFYSIEVYFQVEKRYAKSGRVYYKTEKVKFLDSMKVINSGVGKIAKNWGLPILKGEIEYKEYCDDDYELTEKEKAYQINDVQIMAMALKIMYTNGLNKMTIASNAIGDYKKLIGKAFSHYFPELCEEMDADIRKSYKGGFTYLNPLYENVKVGAGMVFDVNSMYPSKMKYELMPIGKPEYFEGKYVNNPIYPLYVQALTCKFELKPGKIPSIQIKNSRFFMGNEYLESSDDEIVPLVLTSVDLELFLENYNVYELEYHGGYMFKGQHGLFDSYIDKWMGVKIESKKKGDKSMYAISKLMLNSLYGKFAVNPLARKKIPYLENGSIKYTDGELEHRKTIYVPVASFITSYARAYIIRTSEAIREYSMKKYGFDAYIYSDTDSIHCLLGKDDLEELSKLISISDYELGAWKAESEFKAAKFIRQKCYIEQGYDDKMNVAVAGMTAEIKEFVTFDNFDYGFNSFDLVGLTKHKKGFRYVEGGVILVDVPFTINRLKAVRKHICKTIRSQTS